jgi:ligand-binding sensor domain-containing protein/two-component sensor histidine kinase
MKHTTLTGFLLVFFQLSFGQHYSSRNFTVNDGLPSNTVRSIFKDSQNRMWIGTKSGLCLFDGTSFKVFGQEDGFNGTDIYSITEDGNQNLWIGTMEGGISKFDDKIVTNYTTKQGLVSDNVRVVWYSKLHHLLFIGTNNGCSVYNGDTFSSISSNEVKTPDLYVMGFLDGPEYLTIYTYNHPWYYRYYPTSNQFSPVKDTQYFHHPTSTSPLILSNHDTIMGDQRSGIRIINDNKSETFYNIGQAFDLELDDQGNVWIACWGENSESKTMPGGLYQYDGKEVHRYREKVGIDDPSVWCLYYDTTFHILWVGTLNSGLFKIPQLGFEWFDRDDLGVKELNVTALYSSDDNDLWIGTKGALLHGTPGKEVKRCQDYRLHQTIGLSNPLEYRCITTDNIGNIYSCVYQSPLIRFSPNNHFSDPEIIRIKPGATQFTFNNHNILYYGDRWWDGIYSCSITPVVTTPTFLSFRDHHAPPNMVKMVSQGDTIWYISQTEGVFFSIDDQFTQLSEIDSTIPVKINDLCFDSKGNLIMGSNTGEILIIKQDSIFVTKRLIPGKDLVGNTIRFIVVDHSNHLYIGTNLGLNRIDLNALYAENIVVSNFYNDQTGYSDYSGKVAVCDQTGNIWIGTDEYLYKINIGRLGQSSCIKPELTFTKLEVNNIINSTFNFSKYISFKSKENNLTFYFDDINYLNSDQTRFRYRLHGLTDTWTSYSEENKAVFTSLWPGKYKLIIESYNLLDNGQVVSISYSFRIRYPWYLTWWFIGSCTLILIGIILFILRYRINQIKKKEIEKSEITRQLATLEMRALQSQMNPHFIFNSINSIQGFILKNMIDEARGYLMDFSKILRQTLENASKEFISLAEELQYIKYYLNLEQMRFDKNFQTEIQLQDNIDPQIILIPPMVIQPFVENAIRHGLMHKQDGEKQLRIEFYIDGDILKCVIEDNGVGRKKSMEIESWRQHEHKPQSTKITQDRIDLLNKTAGSTQCQVKIIDLYDKVGMATGTRVEISLPLITSES